nr:uncharacterized protein LOC111837609 [Paramormyrops kingsleyae]XP_023655575.1 uncharacterized protein LOC111837609 [Paramormyrops kingsleyae]XP_023655576.1 uncharacterized protein LOC111837609 [Paramormyrops kingsleyae]
MRACGQTGGTLLSCLLCVAVPALLRPDAKLAYVTEGRLCTCSCSRDLVACSAIGHPECKCTDWPQSGLNGPDGSRPLTEKRLTVLYTSPLNVALLLNNSEVHHLSLVKCSDTGGKVPTQDYFAVLKLEKLTVSYPLLQASQSHDFVLGTPYHDGETVSIIHMSVLMGKPSLKAYTIQAKTDSNGLLPFASLCVSPIRLPEPSRMFVTFLY